MKDAVSLSIDLIKNKRWLFCCLLFFCVCNCNYAPDNKNFLTKKAFDKILVAQNDIQDGDIITRLGNDFTSECLRQINVRDKTWSHCGIASIEHDSIFIYHALGGEFNPDQRLRRDYLYLYADPNTTKGIGIFRHQLSAGEISQLIYMVKKMYTAGVMFDMKFDLETDERMYCAEFVYKAFLWATGQRVQFNTSTVKEKKIVGVDDVFLYRRCKQIKKVFYKD
jgi:Permuted papain-like amidase enzyme, YaeF/YiiX, C92 family